MNSKTMTILGALLGAIGFATANLPDNTPEWVGLILGSILAGGSIMGGYSHPGTPSKRTPLTSEQVHARVVDRAADRAAERATDAVLDRADRAQGEMRPKS